MMFMRAKSLFILIAVFAATSMPRNVGAFPSPWASTRIASGFSRPIFVSAPPGDTTRIFVVEQRGSGGVGNQADIKIINLPSFTVNGTSFFSITGVNIGNEEGLLGFAFHPNFFAAPGNVNRGAFFVYYTSGGNNHVVRYTTLGQDPTANYDPASAQTVIDFTHPAATNHNGGWIAFGPDGYLYIATGDGGPGSGCDPNQQAQDINHYLGKMHRLDVDADQNASATIWGYLSPATNPYVGIAGLDEIYHLGLRNPWRNSFDRGTGDLYMGDVGQFVKEEISLAPSGAGSLNFGWDCMEGFSCASVSCAAPFGCICGGGNLTLPITDYDQTLAGRCAVTGGYVYRGPSIPENQGAYFFADYCSNEIWTMPAGGGAVTAVQASLSPSVNGFTVNTITSFGEDANGELYICDQGGEIFRIHVSCSGASMSVAPHPLTQSACQGATVNFTVGVSGNRGATLYTWRKNTVPIGAPSSPTLTLTNVTPANNGAYDCMISDQCSSVTTNAANLTVNIPGAGDEDADCDVDLDDLPIFVNVLLGLDMDPGHFTRADMNSDGARNGADIGPFTDLIVP